MDHEQCLSHRGGFGTVGPVDAISLDPQEEAEGKKSKADEAPEEVSLGKQRVGVRALTRGGELAERTSHALWADR